MANWLAVRALSARLPVVEPSSSIDAVSSGRWLVVHACAGRCARQCWARRGDCFPVWRATLTVRTRLLLHALPGAEQLGGFIPPVHIDVGRQVATRRGSATPRTGQGAVMERMTRRLRQLPPQSPVRP